MNLTLVPFYGAPATIVTVRPAGAVQLTANSVVSPDSRIKAGAVLAGADANGSVSLYANRDTQVIVDISGYFVPDTGPSALAFYPITPCRIADTRNPVGPFGGPALAAGETRTFYVPSSSCAVPSSAQAYSLNLTVLPATGGHWWLTLWPTGQSEPFVSTLNSYTGTLVSNAAVAPAGLSGGIKLKVTGRTDLILDINGYFADPSMLAGGNSFYPLNPCRVAEESTAAVGTRSFSMISGACGVPSGAAAYATTATVTPSGYMNWLSLWPAGQAMPGVSTLNAWDGAITANLAVVPAGAGGSISAYTSDAARLTFDAGGYFGVSGCSS